MMGRRMNSLQGVKFFEREQLGRNRRVEHVVLHSPAGATIIRI